MTMQGIFSEGTSDPDLISGTEFSDTLSGDSGNDTIRALGGDDFLRTSFGPDFIEGGRGNDVFRLILTNAGSAFGLDTLLGGEGDDIFILPRESPDTPASTGSAWRIDGGPGIDTLFIDDSNGVIGIDLATGVYSRSGRTLSGVENVIAIARMDMSGNEANNLLVTSFNSTVRGRAGDDTIFGSGQVSLVIAFDDSLDGGDGDDWLIGNTGNDTLLGGNGADIVFGGPDGDLILGGKDSDNMFGEAGNDTLEGGAEGDRYAGGSGADVFHLGGGVGLDTIYDFNRAEGDKISITANLNGSGIDAFAKLLILTDAGGSLVFLGDGGGGANWLAVLGVNDLSAADVVFVAGPVPAPVFLVGTPRADLLTGTPANDTLDSGGTSDGGNDDTLRGFSGDDVLIARGPGNDSLEGGDGDDLLMAVPVPSLIPNGKDRFLGGDGNDTIEPLPLTLGSTSAKLFVDGGQGIDTLRLAQFDLIKRPIDLATGIIENDGRVTFTGIEIFELTGSWSVSGSAGNDSVAIDGPAIALGLGGDDTLVGGREAGPGAVPPDDVLDGGAGNDSLNGRAGNDTLIGGSGADVFRFENASDRDQIVDFSRAQGDKISILPNVNGGGITSFANLPLVTDAQGTRIDLGGGHQITVLGVIGLQAGDFIFA